VRHRSWWLWACAIAVYAFLYLPLSVVVAFSFNDSKLSAEWVGFTLDWYRKLFADDEMLAAAWNSLVIAVIAAAVATVLGTMAGIAIHRYRMRVLLFMVLTPVAMPEILLGVSLLIFFISVFGADALSLATVVIAHITSASASSQSSSGRGSRIWTRPSSRQRGTSVRPPGRRFGSSPSRSSCQR
jgi:spermidine/putrescine transport system permease protein